MNQEHSELILETEEGVGPLPSFPSTKRRSLISQIISQSEIEQYRRQVPTTDSRWNHIGTEVVEGTHYTIQNGKEWLMGREILGNTMLQQHQEEYILKMPLNNRTRSPIVSVSLDLPYGDWFVISLRSTGKLLNRQCYRIHLYNLNGQVLAVKFGVLSVNRFKNWRDMEIPLHDNIVQLRIQDAGQHVLLDVNGYQMRSPPLLRIIEDFYLHFRKPKKGTLSVLNISYGGKRTSQEGICGCSNNCSVF